MAKRKTHTLEFKAKVTLEAIREEMTLAGRPVRAMGDADIHRRTYIAGADRALSDQGRDGWRRFCGIHPRRAGPGTEAWHGGHHGQPRRIPQCRSRPGDPGSQILVPLPACRHPHLICTHSKKISQNSSHTYAKSAHTPSPICSKPWAISAKCSRPKSAGTTFMPQDMYQLKTETL